MPCCPQQYWTVSQSQEKKAKDTETDVSMPPQSNHQLLPLLTIRCQCYCRAALQQGGGVLRECLGKIKRPQSAAWAQPLEQVSLHLCPGSTTQPLFKAENAPLCYSSNPTHPEPLSVLLQEHCSSCIYIPCVLQRADAFFQAHFSPRCGVVRELNT